MTGHQMHLVSVRCRWWRPEEIFSLITSQAFKTQNQLERKTSSNVFIFIEFIGVTLVSKTIQVSGVQFYNVSSIHLLCVHHLRSSLSHYHLSPLYPLLSLPYPHFPLAITMLSSVSMSFLFAESSPFSPSPTTHLPSDSTMAYMRHFQTKEKRETRYQISEVTMGDLQVVQEQWNPHGRNILTR